MTFVVAGEDDWGSCRQQVDRMGRQALEPAQLVVELRAGRRIAVRQVEATDEHAVDRRFDISAVHVGRVARQAPPGFLRLLPARQDRDTVPALLTMPDRAVAGVAKRALGEFILRRLEFLKTYDVRSSLAEPAQQDGQAPIHAIDVEGSDFHS